MEIRAGSIIDGKYAVERALGSGNGGQVLLARDIHLARLVAIKVIGTGKALTARQLERFRREAAGLAAIRHTNVVGLFAFGIERDSPFFAMEYVEGPSLGKLIEEHRQHGEFVHLDVVRRIVTDIAGGLQAVHDAGLLHRDVKPDNVVIETRTGRPVLVDFGLSHASDEDDAPGAFAGTPAYMAPEQTRAEAPSLSRASDLYSLACLAYELLTGELPHPVGSLREIVRAHQDLEAAPLSRHRPDLTALDAVFARALSKDPSARFASAVDFATAVNDSLAASSAPPPPIAYSDRPVSASLQVGHEEQGATPNERRQILIVDDDDVFRRLAIRSAQVALARTPLKVRACGSGEQAVQSAVEKGTPDLVILDYSLPGMDGVETLAALRGLPDGDRCRVVVVSGNLSRVERWRFGVLGVSDFVEKPVGFSDLVSLVKELATHAGWSLS